jgi:NADPH2:quinone reductase
VRAATIVNGRIEVRDHPEPEPGYEQILVRVKAAGLNGADLMQRAGRYPPPPGFAEDMPGLELAGEVVALGPGTRRFRVGDRVMSIVSGAGQAELAVVHERQVMPVPDRNGTPLPWEEAGGFPEVFTTACDALFSQAHLGLGQRLLVNGAAGGVGTAAVQLAAAAGARVVASVRSDDQRDGVAALAAGVVAIAPGEEKSQGPYDVVLELVGGPNIPMDLDVLDSGGRVVVIGVGAGPTAEVDLRVLMSKRARILASTLRARPLEGKAAAARQVESGALPLVTAGRIAVPVAATFPLKAAAEAYERFERGGKLGKVVLIMP